MSRFMAALGSISLLPFLESLWVAFFVILTVSFIHSASAAVSCTSDGLNGCNPPNTNNTTVVCNIYCQECYPLKGADGVYYPTLYATYATKCGLFCNPSSNGSAACAGAWGPTDPRQVGCAPRSANSNTAKIYKLSDGKVYQVYGYCEKCEEGYFWDAEAVDKSNPCVVAPLSVPAGPPPKSVPSPPRSASSPPPGAPAITTSGSPPNTTTGTPPSSSTGKSTSKITRYAIPIAVLILVLAVVVTCVNFLCRRKRYRPLSYSSQAPPSSYVSYPPPIPVPAHVPFQPPVVIQQPLPPLSASFTVLPKTSVRAWRYSELQAATNNFSLERVLGRGGFGTVYKGDLEGAVVAVKRLAVEARQGHEEFIKEVDIIGKVHHRNLVNLQGYCIEREERLLVYDFMANGSLEDWLFDSKRGQLPWFEWMRILLGTAHAIAYLHHGCKDKIIHRDIKPANILLDANFEAHVADFGLARNTLVAETHVSTRVMGTFGFLAPEYAHTGQLTEKSDVYSFGVVMLVVACNRRPIDVQAAHPNAVGLVEVVFTAMDENRLPDMVASHFDSPDDRKEAMRMISIALLCVQSPWQMRPSMEQVVKMMASTEEIPLTDVHRGASAYMAGSDKWSSQSSSVKSRESR